MGAQISLVFALHDFQVVSYDVDKTRLQSGLDLIRNGKYGLLESVKKGRLSQEKADETLSKIMTTDSLDSALSGSEFVLEAAVEDLATKQHIFEKAASVATIDCILSTNTSTLSIARIAEGISDVSKRKRLVGMHFFNPPQVMKLVEVVRTRQTEPEVINQVNSISRVLGKVPVAVLDYPGFVANRIGISVFAEASDILEKGVADVRDIDITMRLGYGYPVGPFELGDLVGLDARLRNMEALYSETGDEKFKPPELLRRLVAEGYLGDPKTKPGSKGGYYEYFGLVRPSDQI
jgi:3-hydroxybutyryl-CoA dehydrogenase